MEPDEEVLSIPSGARYPSIQSGEDFDVYAQGYYEAATTLYKSYWGDGSEEPAFDWVVWPILALLNHYVELELKEIIRLCYSIGSSNNTQVRDVPSKGTHDLENLLEIADFNLNNLGLVKAYRNPVSHASRSLIQDLQRFSPNGEGLRYPLKIENLGGGPTLPDSYVVDIPAILKIMDKMYHEFLGAVGLLSHIEENI